MMRRPQPQSQAGGAETVLRSKASMVVLMREGRRTVLTMQNDYQGPIEDFALLVPVPEVLSRDQIRTLPHGLFERVDALSAPRLVEFWEQNPCGGDLAQNDAPGLRRARGAGRLGGRMEASAGAFAAPPPVRVEAEYRIDEYDIVLLSARDADGLTRWLTDNGYRLPPGAAPVLAPYIARGTKFFVARVNAQRLRFRGGQAQLSPLQFSFDSDTFGLPIRLGLLNSPGQQDLVVMLFGRDRRYEVASHPNLIMPTDLPVDGSVRDRVAEVYDGLFEAVRSQEPGAVVTEYAADLQPGDLSDADLRRLGADALLSRNTAGFTLTRLHYRYTRDTIGDDLVFRTARPIGGGDGTPAIDGTLGSSRARRRMNNSFRTRLAIVNRWQGGASCARPQRGRWRRPANTPATTLSSAANPTPIGPLALDTLLTGGLASLGLENVGAAAKPGSAPLPGATSLPGATPLPGVPAFAAAPGPTPIFSKVASPSAASSGLLSCGVATRGSRGGIAGALVLAGLALGARRSRRR